MRRFATQVLSAVPFKNHVFDNPADFLITIKQSLFAGCKKGFSHGIAPLPGLRFSVSIPSLIRTSRSFIAAAARGISGKRLSANACSSSAVSR